MPLSGNWFTCTEAPRCTFNALVQMSLIHTHTHILRLVDELPPCLKPGGPSPLKFLPSGCEASRGAEREAERGLPTRRRRRRRRRRWRLPLFHYSAPCYRKGSTLGRVEGGPSLVRRRS